MKYFYYLILRSEPEIYSYLILLMKKHLNDDVFFVNKYCTGFDEKQQLVSITTNLLRNNFKKTYPYK